MYRTLAVACAGAMMLSLSWSLAAELDGIYGSTAPDAASAAPPFPIAGGADQPRPRSFPGQPPTTPHSIHDDYKFGLAENRCLLCHSPSSPTDMTALTHAPKLSPSHLVARDGHTASDVTASHRFCASCHVIQTEASPPVGNTFRSTNRETR
jgi:nitrate reductase (cytochrome), electron transfer subunit